MTKSIPLVSHSAAARLPIVQRTAAFTAPELLFLTNRTKLDTAEQMEESAVPAKINLTELALPPMFARKITPIETPKAPRNAIMPI